MLERRDDGFCLRISDDGPGLSPEGLARLAQRAFRGDAARSRNTTGSGLGGAIASTICERAGWNLSFSDGEPTGLIVTIQGPIS